MIRCELPRVLLSSNRTAFSTDTRTSQAVEIVHAPFTTPAAGAAIRDLVNPLRTSHRPMISQPSAIDLRHFGLSGTAPAPSRCDLPGELSCGKTVNPVWSPAINSAEFLLLISRSLGTIPTRVFGLSRNFLGNFMYAARAGALFRGMGSERPRLKTSLPLLEGVFHNISTSVEI